MSKCRSTVTVILLLIGLGLIISGMLTSSIVKVCQKTFQKLPPSKSHISSSEEQMRRNPPIEVCVGQGLFDIGFSVADASFSVATPLKKGSITVRTVAGLLFMGCVGSIVSAFYFILTSCNAGYEMNYAIYITLKRNAIGTVVQFLNVVLVLSALSIFTNYKMKTIGNRKEFFGQLSHALTGWELLLDSDEIKNHNGIGGPSSFMINPPPPPPPSGNRRSRLSENDLSQTLVSNNSTVRGQSLLDLILDAREPSSSGNGEQNETNREEIRPQNILTRIFSPKPSIESELTALPIRNDYNTLRSRRPPWPPRPPRLRLPQITAFGMRIMGRVTTSQPTIGYSFWLLWAGLFFFIFPLVLGIRTWIVVFKEKKLLEKKISK